MLCSWLALLVPHSMTNAADISSKDLGENLTAILIAGTIEKGDSEVFRREAAKHSSAVVILMSDGGFTLEAIEIGETIRILGFTTLVTNGTQCVSACALIWLAGTPRSLSKSARIGFHATYTDERGRRLESGVGNALVGRYLAILNLPQKAIVFATMAPPDDMVWLDTSNYADLGIETKIIDDFGAAEAEPKSEFISPKQTRSQGTEETSLWEAVGHWRVMVDSTLGDSCFALTSFTYGTVFRIGLNRKSSESYFFLTNTEWKSLRPGGSHNIEFQFDDLSPWEAEAEVVDLNGLIALSVSFTDNDLWGEFAGSEWLHFKTGGRSIAKLSLDLSTEALSALIECQKHYNSQWDGKDPFAK